jgi:predicted neutral ceramidase superfamily lipid hydrolase
VSERPPGPARGSFLLYAIAFGFLVAAGVVLVIAATSFLESLPVLWTSVVLSILAIVTAVAGVVVPRR